MQSRKSAWVVAVIVVVSGLCIASAAEPEEPPHDSPPQETATRADTQPPVIHLDVTRYWILQSGTDRAYLGVLGQELVRQAVLIAAREELGLVTRDVWLGDPMPTDPRTPRIDLRSETANPSPVKVLLCNGGQRRTIAGFSLDPDDVADFRRLTTLMEEYSRVEFPGILRRAGYPDVADPRLSEVAVPEDIETLLAEMTFVAQFQAVRKLHALIRAEGESRALLGALVRGYGNLGMLTEFYWHPAHKVCRARAMLYAQRLLAREPDSVWAHWIRAYAMGITGLHKLALDDLATAAELRKQSSQDDAPQPPPWLDVIEAYCRYDVARLRPEKAAPAVKELTALLLVVAQDESADGRAAVNAALRVLPTMPECYRIWEVTCTQGGVALWHSATLSPLNVVGETLYARLQAMPDLPESVRQITTKRTASPGLMARLFGAGDMPMTEEFKLRPSLVAALKDPSLAATDPGTPSWASLGQLIQELSFVHVMRRAGFERNSLGVSTDDFLETSAPLVANHRLYPYIESYAWDPAKRQEASERLAQADLTGLDVTASGLSSTLKRADPEKGKDFNWRIVCRADYIARDLSRRCRIYPFPTAAKAAHTLREVSPYQPQARARLIEGDWESVKDEAVGWEEESSQHALPLVMLGTHYCDEGRLADAERCLKAAVDISHLQLAHQRLADVYKRQGKIDEAVATLEDYCTYPDYGLGHGSVNQTIARLYISAGNWQKALPYAEEAASTGAGWGMLCLADCHEGMHRWEEAEALSRATSQRYRGSRLTWYFFCRRTGRGNLDAARRYAEDSLKDYNPTLSEIEASSVAAYYLLEDDPEKALEIAEPAYAKSNNPYYALEVAVLADKLGRAETRDAALQRAIAYGVSFANASPASQRKSLVGLAHLLVDDLAKGGKGEIDPQAAKALRDLTDNADHSSFSCFLGMYLSHRDKETEAVEYWKDCMQFIPQDSGLHFLARTLASAALQQHGVDPEEYMPLAEEAGPDDQLDPSKETLQE